MKTFSTNLQHDKPLWIYQISFYWYTLMGAMLVILIGFPASLYTRNDDDDVSDERFLTPLLRRKSKLMEQAKKEYTPVLTNENGIKNFELNTVCPAMDTN